MKNELSPQLTVVIATLNAATTIHQCLTSIIEQTVSPIEIVVIDGGSKDETQSIVQSFGDKISYFVSQEDRGVYEAFNKGIKASQGEWIMFLGSDDFLHNSKSIEEILSFVKTHAVKERIVYGQIEVQNENLGSSLFGKSWDDSREDFKHFMSIPHVGMLHHRTLFEDYGGFNETFKIAGDYEFLMRELRLGKALFVPGVIVAVHRTGGLSTNPRFGFVSHMEQWRARRINGFRFPGFRWIFRLPRVLFLPILISLLGSERGILVHKKIKQYL